MNVIRDDDKAYNEDEIIFVFNEHNTDGKTQKGYQ